MVNQISQHCFADSEISLYLIGGTEHIELEKTSSTKTLWPLWNIFMRLQCNIAALYATRKFHRGTACFLCAMQQERFGKCCMRHQKKINENSFFSCCMQHFCCMKHKFLSVAPWSHSMKRFREAQFL